MAGHTEKLEGFWRLDRLTREVDKQCEPFADFDAAIARERAISKSIGGSTVFDDKVADREPAQTRQLNLF